MTDINTRLTSLLAKLTSPLDAAIYSELISTLPSEPIDWLAISNGTLEHISATIAQATLEVPHELERSFRIQLILGGLAAIPEYEAVAHQAVLHLCQMVLKVEKAASSPGQLHAAAVLLIKEFIANGLPNIQESLLPILQQLLLLSPSTKEWKHAEFLLLFESFLALPDAISADTNEDGLTVVDQVLTLQARLSHPFNPATTLSGSDASMKFFITCLKFAEVLGSVQALNMFKDYFFQQITPRMHELPFQARMDLFGLMNTTLQHAGVVEGRDSVNLVQLVDSLYYSLKNYKQLTQLPAASTGLLSPTTPSSNSSNFSFSSPVGGKHQKNGSSAPPFSPLPAPNLEEDDGSVDTDTQVRSRNQAQIQSLQTLLGEQKKLLDDMSQEQLKLNQALAESQQQSSVEVESDSTAAAQLLKNKDRQIQSLSNEFFQSQSRLLAKSTDYERLQQQLFLTRDRLRYEKEVTGLKITQLTSDLQAAQEEKTVLEEQLIQAKKSAQAESASSKTPSKKPRAPQPEPVTPATPPPAAPSTPAHPDDSFSSEDSNEYVPDKLGPLIDNTPLSPVYANRIHALKESQFELTNRNKELAKEVIQLQLKIKEITWDMHLIRCKTAGEITAEQQRRIDFLEKEVDRLYHDKKNRLKYESQKIALSLMRQELERMRAFMQKLLKEKKVLEAKLLRRRARNVAAGQEEEEAAADEVVAGEGGEDEDEEEDVEAAMAADVEFMAAQAAKAEARQLKKQAAQTQADASQQPVPHQGQPDQQEEPEQVQAQEQAQEQRESGQEQQAQEQGLRQVQQPQVTVDATVAASAVSTSAAVSPSSAFTSPVKKATIRRPQDLDQQEGPVSPPTSPDTEPASPIQGDDEQPSANTKKVAPASATGAGARSAVNGAPVAGTAATGSTVSPAVVAGTTAAGSATKPKKFESRIPKPTTIVHRSTLSQSSVTSSTPSTTTSNDEQLYEDGEAEVAGAASVGAGSKSSKSSSRQPSASSESSITPNKPIHHIRVGSDDEEEATESAENDTVVDELALSPNGHMRSPSAAMRPTRIPTSPGQVSSTRKATKIIPAQLPPSKATWTTVVRPEEETEPQQKQQVDEPVANASAQVDEEAIVVNAAETTDVDDLKIAEANIKSAVQSSNEAAFLTPRKEAVSAHQDSTPQSQPSSATAAASAATQIPLTPTSTLNESQVRSPPELPSPNSTLDQSQVDSTATSPQVPPTLPPSVAATPMTSPGVLDTSNLFICLTHSTKKIKKHCCLPPPPLSPPERGWDSSTSTPTPLSMPKTIAALKVKHREEMLDLQEQLTQLQQTLIAMDREYRKVVAENKSLTATVTAQKDVISTQNPSLTDSTNNTAVELAAAKNQIVELDNTIRDGMIQVEELSSELFSQMSKMKEYEAQVKDEKQHVAELDDQLNEAAKMIQEKEAKIVELEQAVAANANVASAPASDSNSDLAQRLQETEAQLVNAQREVQQYLTLYTDLTASSTQSTQRIEELSTNLSASSQKIDQLSSDLSTSTQRVAEQQKRIQELESQLAAVPESQPVSSESSAQRVKELETQLVETEAELSRVKTQLSESIAAAATVTSEAKPSSSSDEEELKTTLIALTNKCQQLQGELSASQQSHADMSVLLDRQTLELTTTVQKVNDLVSELDQSKSELSEARNQLNDAKTANQELTVASTQSSERVLQLENLLASMAAEKLATAKTKSPAHLELEESHQKLGDSFQKLTHDYQTVQTQLTKEQQDMQTSRAQIEQLKQELTSLQAIHAASLADNPKSDLEATITSLTNEVSTLKSNLASQTDLLTTTQTSLAESQQQNADAQANIHRLQTQLLSTQTQLTQELSALQTKSETDLQSLTSSHAQQIQQFEQDLIQARVERVELSNQLQASETKLTELQATHEVALNQLKSELTQSQTELTATQATLARSQSVLKESETNSINERHALEAAHVASLAQVESNLTQSTAALNEANLKIAKLTTELDQLKAANMKAMTRSVSLVAAADEVAATHTVVEQLAALKTTLAEKEATIAELYAESENAILQLKNENETAVEQMQANLDARTNELTKTQTELTQTKKELAAAVEKSQSTEVALETVSTELEDAKVALWKANKDLEAQRVKLTAAASAPPATADSTKLKELEASHQRVMDALSAELDEAVAAQTATASELAQVKAELAALRVTNQQLFSDATAAANSVSRRQSFVPSTNGSPLMAPHPSAAAPELPPELPPTATTPPPSLIASSSSSSTIPSTHPNLSGPRASVLLANTGFNQQSTSEKFAADAEHLMAKKPQATIVAGKKKKVVTAATTVQATQP